MGLLSFIFGNRNEKITEDQTALNFDELNPLLAKQLTEVDTQIGQLAQVQFEMAEERERMRNEMDALKKVLLQARTGRDSASAASNNEKITENEAT